MSVTFLKGERPVGGLEGPSPTLSPLTRSSSVESHSALVRLQTISRLTASESQNQLRLTSPDTPSRRTCRDHLILASANQRFESSLPANRVRGFVVARSRIYSIGRRPGCFDKEKVGPDRRRRSEPGSAVRRGALLDCRCWLETIRPAGGRCGYRAWRLQSPKTSFASSLETEPAMMTSSPCFQLTGVATRCLAVSWSESMTRRLHPNCDRSSSDTRASA